MLIWNDTELIRSCKPHIYHLEQLQRVCSAVIIPSCWALCCPQTLISELLKLNAFRDEMQLSAFSLPFQTHGVRGCKHFFAVYISSCLRNTNIYKLFYAPKSQRKTTHTDALLRNGGIDSHYILSRWVRLFFSDSYFKQRQIKIWTKNFPVELRRTRTPP